MIQISRANFPDVVPPEFRPGLDNVTIAWDSDWNPGGYSNCYASIRFSGDGGDLWNDVSLGIPLSASQVSLDVLAPSSFEVSWPIGMIKGRTHNGKFEVTIYKGTSIVYGPEESDNVIIAPWPDSYIKSVFPETRTVEGGSGSSVLLIGLGNKRLTPVGYPFRIETERELNALFAPDTSVAQAWRLMNRDNLIDTFVMRSGDLDDYKAIGPGTPRAWNYLLESLEECYLKAETMKVGVVCPVDGVLDLEDFGIGNVFGQQLAEFCYNQTHYQWPVVGVINASTVPSSESIMRQYNVQTLGADTPCPIRTAALSGGKRVVYSSVPMDGISLLGADQEGVDGVGLLEYDTVTRMITWAQPGDSAGTPIPIAADGKFSISSAGGARLHIYVQKLPAGTGIITVEVLIGLVTGSPGAKFVIPVFGYSDIVYNDPITGTTNTKRVGIARAVAATLSVIGEASDPLNKTIRGLDSGVSVPFEALLTVFEKAGIASVRQTIGSGYTISSGVNAAARVGASAFLATTQDPSLWGYVKNVRAIGQIIREMRDISERTFIGGQNVKPAAIERTLQAIVNRYVGTSLERGSISVVRDTDYTARVLFEAVVVGTIRAIVMSFLIGA